jgi:hypothetical protein
VTASLLATAVAPFADTTIDELLILTALFLSLRMKGR